MIVDELRVAGIPLFETHLRQRAAYPALFAYRTTLACLDPVLVNGIPAAIENADRLVAEVVEIALDRKDAA